MTMVSRDVRSEYGVASCKFEGGVSSGGGDGSGKDPEALGTMRNVDAGATTLVSSCGPFVGILGIGAIDCYSSLNRENECL